MGQPQQLISYARPEASAGDNIVSLPRKSLFQELATTVPNNSLYSSLEASIDVQQLVADSCATRTDLRRIEDGDDEVQQCIETRIAALLNVDWRLDGGSVANNQWLTEQTKRHYTELVTNAISAMFYGYNVMERVWKLEDGRYIVDRVTEKPFEWFVPYRDGRLFFRPRNSLIALPAQLTPTGEVLVDTEFKFLLTRYKPTYRNPRGRALLAVLFWPWFFRKATWQFWMQFLERSGAPLLVGKGGDPKQMAMQLAAAVQDAVIAVPKEGSVEAISPKNTGEAFVLAEEHLVKRIQKVLLGQTLTSDTATKGSGAKSLGEVHNDVRQDKTLADLKLVGPTVQNYIDALVSLNFPSSTPVKLIHAIDRGLETGRANRDALLLNTGTVLLTEAYYQREYGFQAGDMKIIDPAKAKKNSQPGQDPQGSGNNNSGGSNNSNATDLILPAGDLNDE